MTKCNYCFVRRGNTIVIDDLNKGNMSVTNDIENVISEINGLISESGQVSIDDYNVIYRDSTGRYDGVRTDAGAFVSFYSINVDDVEEALKLVPKKMIELDSLLHFRNGDSPELVGDDFPFEAGDVIHSKNEAAWYVVRKYESCNSNIPNCAFFTDDGCPVESCLNNIAFICVDGDNFQTN